MQSTISLSPIEGRYGADTLSLSNGKRQIAGDVFDMSQPVMDVELVLGFRPGRDRLRLPMVGQLGFREVGGNVVISHRGGEIILQGVTLVELANGLEAH